MNLFLSELQTAGINGKYLKVFSELNEDSKLDDVVSHYEVQKLVKQVQTMIIFYKLSLQFPGEVVLVEFPKIVFDCGQNLLASHFAAPAQY